MLNAKFQRNTFWHVKFFFGENYIHVSRNDRTGNQWKKSFYYTVFIILARYAFYFQSFPISRHKLFFQHHHLPPLNSSFLFIFFLQHLLFSQYKWWSCVLSDELSSSEPTRTHTNVIPSISTHAYKSIFKVMVSNVNRVISMV